MVCPSCGARNSEELKSCAQCGRGLVASADESRTAVLDEGASPPPLARAAAAGSAAPGGLAWGALPSQAIPTPPGMAPGTTVGRYRIESLLGAGGMGAVYRAFDTELDRVVALKVVRPELAGNPHTVKRCKQDLLRASRISHKNILRIHDLGDADGTKFITMAFVEGTDLGRLIDRTGALPIERALALGRQLFAALEAAHAEGVA